MAGDGTMIRGLADDADNMEKRVERIETQGSEVHAALLGTLTPEGRRVPGFIETMERRQDKQDAKIKQQDKRVTKVEETVDSWRKRMFKSLWAVAVGFLGTAGAAIWSLFGGGAK